MYAPDLDEEGNPTGNVLYSMRDVANADGEWTEHVPAEPVSAG